MANISNPRKLKFQINNNGKNKLSENIKFQDNENKINNNDVC